MRLLLDTHALLWWLTDDERLSERARSLIADPGNEIVVSAATAWEVATKARIGKLGSGPSIGDRFGELVALEGFGHLAIDWRHAVRAGSFDTPHRDPFDRMLAAQALLESMVLVTRDPAFAAFDCDTAW